MNEDKIRALVREEIGKAFTLLATAAQNWERSYAYESGADMKREALETIRGVANTAATEIVHERCPGCGHVQHTGWCDCGCLDNRPTPDPLDGLSLMAQILDTLPAEVSPVQLSGRLSVSDPEPVNPFAPRLTAQQWADEIRGVILRAKADGHDVWMSGYTELGEGELNVGNGSDVHVVFKEGAS